MWDLSCPDWEGRIRTGQSLIPTLPLFQDQARAGLSFFDAARLPDQPDEPRLGDASGEWFRDTVRATFGSWDSVNLIRYIRDIFLLAPKGQSKTSYFAGLIIALLLMNRRRNAEGIFVGPTQSISDRAYDQTVGMIELDVALKRRFRTIDHQKTIIDRITGTEAKVKTFSLDILTGGILIFALIDELHLLGRNVHTPKVLRQIRGGLDKTPEGVLLIASTQSDDIPAGSFKEELAQARNIRDGKFKGRLIRPMLPILHEFPRNIAKDQDQWQDPKNWHMVLPNLGRSTHLRDMVPDWNTEKEKGSHAIRIWASQHLNIEIGLGLKTDAWPGAEYWERRTDPTLTFEELLRRSEVIVPGGDGGGLDDLLGLTLLGRDRETKFWLSWSHGWCHRSVLERRKSIASLLEDFAKAGELTIVDENILADKYYGAMREAHERAKAAGLSEWLDEDAQAVEALRLQVKEQGFPDDIAQFVDRIAKVKDAGLLAEVAVDPAGLGLIVDALDAIGITQENGLLVGVRQGYALMNATKTGERKLENGTFWHAPSSLMDWNVSNVKIEPTATAIRATKQNAGDAKIDLWAAMIDAVDRMGLNPVPAGSRRSYLETEELLVL